MCYAKLLQSCQIYSYIYVNVFVCVHIKVCITLGGGAFFLSCSYHFRRYLQILNSSPKSVSFRSVLLRSNYYRALCKFKVYSTRTELTYIMK